MTKPRGRPRLSNERVDIDKVIALAVDQLIMWGYSKTQILSRVASAAKTVFPHRGVDDRVLSAGSVEAIWKRQRKMARNRALERQASTDEHLLGWARYCPP